MGPFFYMLTGFKAIFSLMFIYSYVYGELKEPLKLSHSGPSQRQASHTSHEFTFNVSHIFI